MYPDGGGLYLQITKRGSVSWILQYRLKPLRRKMGLGPYPLVSLEDARKRRDDARRKLLDRIDPLAHRAAHRAKQAAAKTFREAARAYIAATASDRPSAKSLQSWKMTMLAEGPKGEKSGHDYCAGIANLPVGSIDTAAVLRVLSPIWRAKPETASKIRRRIEAVIDYAMASGLAERRANPAMWKGNLEHALASNGGAVAHHAAMPWRDVPAFMARLKSAEGSAPAALALAILCASRTGEVLSAQWDEIDLDAKRWTIPAERMKMDVEHVVPLSGAAVELLRGLPRIEAFVFPGAKRGRPMSDRSLSKIMKNRLKVDEFTVHGFRSSFRDWCGNQGIDRELAERSLAHKFGNEVEASYARDTLVERRRDVMEKWARFVTRAAAGDR
jgi:integrase